jgi:anti-sigma-K factor RskA
MAIESGGLTSVVSVSVRTDTPSQTKDQRPETRQRGSMSKQEGWMRRVELVVVVIAVLVIALAYAISRMTAS